MLHQFTGNSFPATAAPYRWVLVESSHSPVSWQWVHRPAFPPHSVSGCCPEYWGESECAGHKGIQYCCHPEGWKSITGRPWVGDKVDIQHLQEGPPTSPWVSPLWHPPQPVILQSAQSFLYVSNIGTCKGMAGDKGTVVEKPAGSTVCSAKWL